MFLPALFTAFALPPEPVTLQLIAAGDILPHRRVKASARTFGWDASFQDVHALISGADLAFANLESPIAPDHHLGIHGEVFNAPATLATGLAETGFDVLSMANNHVWDQGVAGMLETRERVKKAGILPVGVGASCSEATTPTIVTVKGVRVAFLAFVDLLNADLRAGEGAPCVSVPGPLCVDDCLPDRDALFYRANPEVLRAAVQKARERADLVVVSFHWGNEHRTVPLPEYRSMAKVLVGAGADLVLGHHPHVLQPVQTVHAEGRRGLVAYSLGNFLSDMGRTYQPDLHPVRKGNTRDGVLLKIDATLGPSGVQLGWEAIPTYVVHELLPEGEKILIKRQASLPEPLRTLRSAQTTKTLGL